MTTAPNTNEEIAGVLAATVGKVRAIELALLTLAARVPDPERFRIEWAQITADMVDEEMSSPMYLAEIHYRNAFQSVFADVANVLAQAAGHEEGST